VYKRGMELEPDVCYRALASRDSRFDGRFYTGVTSTRIYCRPICPARTPKRGHCRYFRCAAEAEEAGFRPCLRCRPESSPGTPAWFGPSATVSRALRLIYEGALEEDGVDALAERLGVGSRHLRRLFSERVGASPIAIEQTRRVQFAKKLLDETPLPIARVAICSGFGSVRRFNDAVQRAYGRSPSQLRHVGPSSGGGVDLVLRLSFRPPLDWDSMITFLERRAVPGVEVVEGRTYRRTVEMGGQVGIIEVRPLKEEPSLLLSVPLALADRVTNILERVRSMFDLDADPVQIENQLRQDPFLRQAVRNRPGLRVPGSWDRFELGVRAILGQQVTVRGAVTLASRVVDACGGRLPAAERGLSRVFPGPEALGGSRLTRIGMPGARRTAIRVFAKAVLEGELELQSAAGLQEAVGRIRGVRGIGDWTAQYIAMRALREPDAFPASDLGVRRALAGGKALPTPGWTIDRAEAWRPWRAYATMHLWALGSNGPKRKE